MERPGRRRQWPGAVRFRWIAAVWIVILAAWGIATRMPGTRSAGKLAQAGMLLLALSIAIAACGGDSGVPAGPPPGTPPGTYTMNVTATVTVAGQPNVTRTMPLDLTIQ